jgi:hypothetical protein
MSYKMTVNPALYELLNVMNEELGMLKCEVEYEGYDSERISNEKAIGMLCTKMMELVTIIQENILTGPPEMTKEDYEAIYGWGGQG